MCLILLLALAQTPVTGPTIEGHVDAFLKGEGAARAALMKMGVYSIRPLQRARDKDPRRIDALLYEIKMAAAYPSPTPIPGPFEDRRGMVQNRQWPEPGLLVQVFVEKGIPLFTDQFDNGRLIPTRLALFNPSSRLQLIELFCQDTGLDYGFFHNSVVIGMSERLWPEQGQARITPLNEAELARARELVGKLSDASIEIREAASRDLIALGTGVMSLLEAQFSRGDEELESRCEALLRLLRRKTCPFGPAACLRQKLAGEDEAILRVLQKSTPKLAIDLAEVAKILGALAAAHGVKFEPALDLSTHISTIRTSGQSLLDVVSLITQSHDLDFLILDGKIVIDGRQAIEKRLAPEK